ncbi:uncharacterized protein LOC126788035 [Argentina anserina]|uniref:uncharacterized protein LOC126788035 n=1 Tax=Argentina anserina TaxID=57926 RepID=UPI00217662BA|nr:uncharacterized protein LOC126788035 [Potentilla anserina]
MAYRRRQQPASGFRFEEWEESTTRNSIPPPEAEDDSLAAKAIRASSAHRDSSLSSAYATRGVHSGSNLSPSAPQFSKSIPTAATPSSLPSPTQPHEYTSMKNLNESKNGFWSVLARKAKAIIDDDEDDNVAQTYDSPGRTRVEPPPTLTRGKNYDPNPSVENRGRAENPTLQKGLGAFTSSLNYISGTIGNALEEGRTIVEKGTADIIQETRKHIRKKPQNQAPKSEYQSLADLELQLKASRDVAMAMAAKAKLLLRELKTVKADLAFAKERCAQLEEESKILRENRDRGESPEDDDLIRLQLETLLAEKARLAHENSVYARENRFLREVVEYHQLTMQDVVYLDEGTEEVTEVYPIKVIPSQSSPPSEVRGVSAKYTL